MNNPQLVSPVPGTPGTQVAVLANDPQGEGVLVAHTVITADSKQSKKRPVL